jgi:hypothetical protein
MRPFKESTGSFVRNDPGIIIDFHQPLISPVFHHRPLDPIDSLLIRVNARVIEEIPERSDHSLADLALEIGFVEDGLDAIECDTDLGSHQTVNCVIQSIE